jgi:hypothetical protein
LLHPILSLPPDPHFRVWIEVNIGGCCSFYYGSVGASVLTTILFFLHLIYRHEGTGEGSIGCKLSRTGWNRSGELNGSMTSNWTESHSLLAGRAAPLRRTLTLISIKTSNCITKQTCLILFCLDGRSVCDEILSSFFNQSLFLIRFTKSL